MHYQHAYHAGNFADVFKHLLVVGLLEALSAKPKPWCCVDTHAGAGLYALGGGDQPRAEGRPDEWREGIGRLWATQPRDALLRRYLALVQSLGGDGPQPQRYPGSPWLAARMARPGDRVVACEQVPGVVALLRRTVPEAEIHQRDGYELHSLLPPPERRGLVLVDPPFERPDEFDAARQFMTRVASRYAGGVVALWYPLKNHHAAAHAVRCLARDTQRPLLDARCDVGSSGDGRMHACGCVVLNPPYGFAEHVQGALAELAVSFGSRASIVVAPVPPALESQGGVDCSGGKMRRPQPHGAGTSSGRSQRGIPRHGL